MGCCGSTETGDEDARAPTERTRLLQDVLAEPTLGSINAEGRGIVPSMSAEQSAQAEAAAEEVEQRLAEVVAQTESDLINIGDSDYMQDLPPTMIAEREKAYAVILKEVSCPPIPTLPTPSALNKTVVAAMREPLVADGDHAMVAAAAAEIAMAAGEMVVTPVDAELVIDLKALTIAQ